MAMFKIPRAFRKTPEAVRLRRADAELTTACEQETDLFAEFGWGIASSDLMRLANERSRRALDELKQAQLAFDAATGEPKPVGLTPAVSAEVHRQFPEHQHQEVSVLLDRSCGRTLPRFREATAEELEHLRLCALRVSKGDLAALRQVVEEAHVDWRDLLFHADQMPAPPNHALQRTTPQRHSSC